MFNSFMNIQFDIYLRSVNSSNEKLIISTKSIIDNASLILSNIDKLEPFFVELKNCNSLKFNSSIYNNELNRYIRFKAYYNKISPSKIQSSFDLLLDIREYNKFQQKIRCVNDFHFKVFFEELISFLLKNNIDAAIYDENLTKDELTVLFNTIKENKYDLKEDYLFVYDILKTFELERSLLKKATNELDVIFDGFFNLNNSDFSYCLDRVGFLLNKSSFDSEIETIFLNSIVDNGSFISINNRLLSVI